VGAAKAGARYVPLKIAERREETDDACTFLLDVPGELREGFAFRPGQHLAVRDTVRGKEERRTYSLCGSPGEWRILVKRVSGGAFSNHANDEWRPGRVVEAMRPQGFFCAPARTPRGSRHLAVAAGSGITPVISILEALLRADPTAQATLIYGNRSMRSIIFRERLADLKDEHMSRLSVFHVLSRERTENDLFCGRLDREKCSDLFARIAPPLRFARAFLCGPEGMMEGARAALAAAKFPPKRIRTEIFTVDRTAAALPETRKGRARAQCEARVVLDGVSHRVGIAVGQTVLEAAAAQGVDLPYSCRGGVCATCKAMLRDGKVEMDANYALGSEERKKGYVLACQSRPLSPRLTLDFDVA